MQTFLPYADFAESARVLDTARLGKQRVEALQVLRAIVLPVYGWQSHPAMQMWRGYVPALTLYGLAMVDEWTAGGRADSTRDLIAEFAPGTSPSDAGGVPLPSWFGDPALHGSHQSNLVRKAPEFYTPLFPGVPNDLPYVWPGPDHSTPRPDGSAGLLVIRPLGDDEFDAWTEVGIATLAEASPRGKTGRVWQDQLAEFGSVPVGTPIAAIRSDGRSLRTGTVTGEVTQSIAEGAVSLARTVEWAGELSRSEFAAPALLQDPRSLFRAPLR